MAQSKHTGLISMMKTTRLVAGGLALVASHWILSTPSVAGSNLIRVSPLFYQYASLTAFNVPADLGAVTRFEVCDSQVLAIRIDGSVRAWGPSGTGYPTDIDFGTIKQLHATRNTFYAVLPSGAVRTWSPGSSASQLFSQPGLGLVSYIDGERDIRIAIRTDKSVWCPGGNLGFCPLQDQKLIPPDLGPVDMVTVGCYDTVFLALQSDGQVRWWGCPGQLDSIHALPTTGQWPEGDSLPLQYSSPVQQLAGGDYGVAVLTADGAVDAYSRARLSCPPLLTKINMRRTIDIFYGLMCGVGIDGEIAVSRWQGPGAPCSVAVLQSRAIDVRSLGKNDTVGEVSMDMLVLTTPTADVDSDGIADVYDNCPSITNALQENSDHDHFGDACDQAVIDCDQDNIEDALGITSGAATDANGNGIPDSCDCLGDINRDRTVDGADLGALINGWGAAEAESPLDLDRNGAVNGADLGYLLNAWGPCPN
jgi:hypothetical protein